MATATRHAGDALQPENGRQLPPESMTAEIATINAKLDLVLDRLAEMNRSGKPGISQAEFARLMKCTQRTVTRMVKDKRLRLEKGRVPHSEVKKYLS